MGIEIAANGSTPRWHPMARDGTARLGLSETRACEGPGAEPTGERGEGV